MSALKLKSSNRCFNGEQRYYTHQSQTTQSEMTFSIYLPDEAIAGKTCPAILYLSGLTCSPDNVTHKAHFQQKCSELGIIFIAPDTSPKGDDIPDDERYYVGQGASYYVDATKKPWANNFKMHSYIIDEFYELVRYHFSISSLGITGHSMGGHGAIMFAFKYPSKFISVSAIAPVCIASESDWGRAAFKEYFGKDANTEESSSEENNLHKNNLHKNNLDENNLHEDNLEENNWQQYDAVSIIRECGKQYNAILIDQGGNDDFYVQGYLRPEALQAACNEVKQPLNLRYHAGFDHSYYYIQSVIDDHIEHHYNAALAYG